MLSMHIKLCKSWAPEIMQSLYLYAMSIQDTSMWQQSHLSTCVIGWFIYVHAGIWSYLWVRCTQIIQWRSWAKQKLLWESAFFIHCMCSMSIAMIAASLLWQPCKQCMCIWYNVRHLRQLIQDFNSELLCRTTPDSMAKDVGHFPSLIL